MISSLKIPFKYFRSAGPALLLTLLFVAPPAAGQHEASNRIELMRSFQAGLYAPSAFPLAESGHLESWSTAADLLHRARSMSQLGDVDASDRLYQQFLDTYPVHPQRQEALLTLADHALTRNAFAEAIAFFRRVFGERPSEEMEAKTHYWIGYAFLRDQRPDSALTAFGILTSDFAQTDYAPNGMYATAYAYIQQGRFDQAARALEVLGIRYPNAPVTASLGLVLAEVYYTQAEYARVLSELDARLPQLEGSSRERGRFLRLESLNQLRRSQDFIEAYERFRSDFPESAYLTPATYSLAWHYHFDGSFQFAAETFAQIASQESSLYGEKSLYYAAINWKRAFMLERAMQSFEAYIAQYPQGSLIEHALYELSTMRYDRRQWSEAIELLSNLILTHPEATTRGPAFLLRANAHIALGDIELAIDDYQSASQLDAAPLSLVVEAEFQQAWLAYRTADYASAVTLFQQLRSREPKTPFHADALFWQAESEYQLERYGTAISLFRDYLSEEIGGKHTAAAWYALGWAHFRRGSYASAIEAFQTYLSQPKTSSTVVPYEIDARLRIADAFFALKQFPQAIRAYAAVSSQGQDYALYQIGQAFGAAGDVFSALEQYRLLLQRYPDSPWREEAQYALARLYFSNQTYNEAIAAYEELILRFPGDPLAARAQYGIADAHYNAGQFEEAFKAYYATLTTYPTSSTALEAVTGMQFAAAAMGTPQLATSKIEEFIARGEHPELHDQILINQAEVGIQAGDGEQSQLILQRVIRSSNDPAILERAYRLSAEVSIAEDDFDTALRILTTTYETLEGDIQPETALVMLGVMLERGRTTHAEALLARVQQKDEWSGSERANIVRYRVWFAFLSRNVAIFDQSLSSIPDLVPIDQRDNIRLEVATVALLGNQCETVSTLLAPFEFAGNEMVRLHASILMAACGSNASGVESRLLSLADISKPYPKLEIIRLALLARNQRASGKTASETLADLDSLTPRASLWNQLARM